MSIPCTVLHPRLFPASPLDPFNPPRVRAVAEIESGALLFKTPGPGASSATMGSETLSSIRTVTINHLSADAQRLEIIRMSAMRYLLVAIVFTAYSFVFHEHDIVYSVFVGTVGALVSAPLFFVFHGGLSVDHEVVRFHFAPDNVSRKFYLEVHPALERGLREALSRCDLQPREE